MAERGRLVAGGLLGLAWLVGGAQAAPAADAQALAESRQLCALASTTALANDKAELTLYSHQFLQLCQGSQATTATMLPGSGPHGWGVFGPLHGQVRCE